MDKYTNMLLLDEALSYLNSDDNDEVVNESVMASICVAMYLILLPFIAIWIHTCVNSVNSAKENKATIDEFLSKNPNYVSDLNKAADIAFNIIKKKLGKYGKYFKKLSITKKSVTVDANRLTIDFMKLDGKTLVKDCVGTDDYHKIEDMVFWDEINGGECIDTGSIEDRINDPEDYGWEEREEDIAKMKEGLKKIKFLENTLDDILKIYTSTSKDFKGIPGVEVKFGYHSEYEEYWCLDLLDLSGYKDGNIFFFTIPTKDYSKMELPDNISKAIKKKVDQAK